MPQIKVKCPQCQLAMTGTDHERFAKPITCPRCNHVFQAVARQTPPPLPSDQAEPAAFRPMVLFQLGLIVAGIVGLVLVVVGAVYVGSRRAANNETKLVEDGNKDRRGSGPERRDDDGGGEGKRYALLIGVNEYKHLGHLRFAENDAVELAGVLSGGGYEITLLTGTEGKRDPGRTPSRANIQTHLELIAKQCKKADTLVLAFAGHGMQFDDEAYFCPSDADEKKPDTMVSLHGIYKAMGNSKAGARLLLVDACRNDGRRSTKKGVTGSTRPPSGVAALFSCSAGEFANESDKVGKGHGVFFHCVIQGLKGEAKNRRDVVTWDSLADYVKAEVMEQVPKLVGGGARQTPHAMADLQGASPVLARYEVKAPVPKTSDKSGKEPIVKTELGNTFTNSIGMKFVRVKAGTFKMGSSEEERKVFFERTGAYFPTRNDESQKQALPHLNAEGPQHEVQITKDFFIGIHEVTQAQWKAVMIRNPSYYCKDGTGLPGNEYFKSSQPAGGKDKVKDLDTDDFPVELVSWEDAKAFLTKLNKLAAEAKFKIEYRLPTEAEWEYACRGGHLIEVLGEKAELPYHFKTPSASVSFTQANLGGADTYDQAIKRSFGRTCKVGSYEPNALGIYDMHGNVAEWCEDWYSETTYTVQPRRNPVGPLTGTYRVLRGGSYVHISNNGGFGRAAHRRPYFPTGWYQYHGFRVVAVARN